MDSDPAPDFHELMHYLDDPEMGTCWSTWTPPGRRNPAATQNWHCRIFCTLLLGTNRSRNAAVPVDSSTHGDQDEQQQVELVQKIMELRQQEHD